MDIIQNKNIEGLKKADWELDFYSRPILESNGKKRWELLITNTQNFAETSLFRWEKRCPAGEVNSLWLADALKEALLEANKQGWDSPQKLRCWRTSMKTMINRAATTLGLEVIASRRTYALQEWLFQREKEIYPNEKGYMAGPLAPPSSPLLNSAIPLPEAVRGDAWSLASIPLGALTEADAWPMEFSGLLPIQKSIIDETIPVPGLRLFSKSRALALAGWLGGLEPVKLVIEETKLILEAGQEDRWLVTDLQEDVARQAKKDFSTSIEKANGLQFISVQATPEEQKFTGFWMCKDFAN